MTDIALERVTHVYPSGVQSLAAVDLAIAAGQRVALIGQNGSGKTTLVQHLNGLLRPTSGRVLIGGADAARRSVARLAATVGLAFQDPDRQIFSGRVRSEVEFGPRNLGRRGGALRSAVDSALDAVALAGQADENPYDLGLSQRKLLAIASVLAMETDVVVLDEPTTGQDLRGLARVRSVVERLARERRTVIAVSHDMDFVAECFERVVAMRAGRVVLDGSPARVFAPDAWAELRKCQVEPPLAARAGARLGLGSTPTDAALIEALAGRAARERSAGQ